MIEKILTSLITLTLIAVFSTVSVEVPTSEAQLIKSIIPDTVPTTCSIEKVFDKKLEVVENKVLKEENKEVKPKIIVKQVTKLNPIEKVYLRMEGVVYEFDIERTKNMLIINVDSLYTTTLDPEEYKGNIFQRIFYRNKNK